MLKQGVLAVGMKRARAIRVAVRLPRVGEGRDEAAATAVGDGALELVGGALGIEQRPLRAPFPGDATNLGRDPGSSAVTSASGQLPFSGVPEPSAPAPGALAGSGSSAA